MSYAGTAAQLGAGSSIGYGATAGGSFTTFLEVVKFSLPKLTASKVKATNMQTTGAIHEYIAGFAEPGEISVEANLLHSDMTALQGMLRSQQFFKIVLNGSGSTFVFPGYLAEIDGDIVVDEKQTSKYKIQVTGAITVT